MRAEIDAFLEALERAEWMALSGRSDAAGVEAIYDRYATLFEPEAFHAVDPPEGDSADDLQRAHLREFLAEGIEGHRTRDLRDAYLAAEASAVVEVDGERIPYRRMPRPDPPGARSQRPRDARQGAPEGGREGAQPHQPGDNAPQARSGAGAAGYRLRRLLRAAGRGRLRRARDHDLGAPRGDRRSVRRPARPFRRPRAPGPGSARDVGPTIWRGCSTAQEFAPLFPGEAMVPGIKRMVSAMGLDLTAGGRIELDIEERPSKTPRAFCATVRVPDEVKLVLQPTAGTTTGARSCTSSATRSTSRTSTRTSRWSSAAWGTTA